MRALFFAGIALVGVSAPRAARAATGACCSAPPALTCSETTESSCTGAGGTFLGEDTTCPVVDRCDCNNNGVLDTDDTALATSLDCNGNDVPDECELAVNDANGNSIPDDCDPVAFAARQLLVVFRSEATNADILSLVSSKGCSVASVISFVNEDTNDDGMLSPGEDANGNLMLDKYEIRVVHIDDLDDEDTTLAEFSVEPLVAAGSLNWNFRLRTHLTIPNDPLFPSQWSLNNIGTNRPPAGGAPLGVIDADIDAPQAWEHSTGSSNVIVAVVDSGIDRGHPDLFGEDANSNGQLDAGEDTGYDRVAGTGDAGEGDGILQTNIWRNTGEIGGTGGVDDDGNGVVDDFVGASFTTNGAGAVVSSNNVQDNDAANSHGTHVSGIIGAIGNNSRGIAGVNWRVSIMPVGTDGRLSSVAAAFRYATRNGARVINLSSGQSPTDFAAGPMFGVWNTLARNRAIYAGILNQIDALAAPGTLVVNAAGYDGCDIDTTSPEDRNCDGVLNAGEDVNCNCVLDPSGGDNLGNGVLDAGEDVGLDGVAGTADAGEGNGRLDCPNPCPPCPLPVNPPRCEDRPDGVADRFLDIPVILTNASLLTVTRSDHRDQFVRALNGTNNTNWGRTSVDVAAPGGGPGAQRGVRSTMAVALGSYGYLAGTSQAAPHVAGIAAHLLSMPAFAGHTTAQVKERILTGRNAPIGVDHPHGVDPRPGVRNLVVSGINNDGRARMVMGDDFGDAADPPYPTLLSKNGARHEDIGEEWLGRAADLPNNLMPPAPAGTSDVSSEFDAKNDAAWPPDPDTTPNVIDMDRHDNGVRLVGPFIFSAPGGPPVRATVDVFVTTENNGVTDLDGGRYTGPHAAGDGVHGNTDDKFVWVNGFIDWDADGDWDDTNEHVFVLRTDPSTWLPSHGGFYRISFNMPPTPPQVIDGPKWVRMRLDYGENAGQALAAPPGVAGPSPGGRVKFWDDPGGLPTAPGMGMRRRYESAPAGMPPALDLSHGLAQFGEVEDYPVNFADHYVCYSSYDRSVNPPIVTLTDQFESGVQFRPKRCRPKSVCTPLEKNDVPINDSATHLQAYKIRRVVKAAEPRQTVDVTNQFGTIRLTTRKATRLLVPTSKSLVAPPALPDPTASGYEHYKCYRVQVVGTPFTPVTINALDQFDDRLLELRKIDVLCTPASKNGSMIKDPLRHLLCYRTRGTTDPPHVFLNNQFGAHEDDLKREGSVCVPSSKVIFDPSSTTTTTTSSTTTTT